MPSVEDIPVCSPYTGTDWKMGWLLQGGSEAMFCWPDDLWGPVLPEHGWQAPWAVVGVETSARARQRTAASQKAPCLNWRRRGMSGLCTVCPSGFNFFTFSKAVLQLSGQTVLPPWHSGSLLDWAYLWQKQENCAFLHMLDSVLVVKIRKNNISLKVNWRKYEASLPTHLMCLLQISSVDLNLGVHLYSEMKTNTKTNPTFVKEYSKECHVSKTSMKARSIEMHKTIMSPVPHSSVPYGQREADGPGHSGGREGETQDCLSDPVGQH